MEADIGYLAGTNARQLYVSYLSTSAIADAIDKCDAQLIIARQQRLSDVVKLWLDIRADLIDELNSRQLTIPGA